MIIDMVEGNRAVDLRRWCEGQSRWWLADITTVATDLADDDSAPGCNGSSAPRTVHLSGVARRCGASDEQLSVQSQGGPGMPLFMDVHTIEGGVTAEDVAQAHQADLETQGRYGVDYKRYWVDEQAGKVFCLVEAPDAEAASTVHREAHGLVADEVYEVSEHS